MATRFFNSYLNSWPDGNTPTPSATVAFTEMGVRSFVGYAWTFPSLAVKGCADPSVIPYQFDTNPNNPEASEQCDYGAVSDFKWTVHSGGYNLGYMDGHAKWAKADGRNSHWARLDPATGYPASYWITRGCSQGTETCTYYWLNPKVEK